MGLNSKALEAKTENMATGFTEFKGFKFQKVYARPTQRKERKYNFLKFSLDIYEESLRLYLELVDKISNYVWK